MRSRVTPNGLEMAGNTLCSVADRLGKIAGPTLGGIALLAGFPAAFSGFAVVIGLSSLVVARLPQPERDPAHAALAAMALEAYREAGCTHVMLELWGEDRERQIELFATRVLPRLDR